MSRWEVRSARRYGSNHEGYVNSEAQATSWAVSDIEKNGNQGRITHIDQKSQVLYYDIYPDDC